MANKRIRELDAGTPALTDSTPLDRSGLTEAQRATYSQLQTLLVDETQVLAVMAALTATLDLNGQTISNVGTVDGRDVSADGTKLDTVQTNADVTDATNVAAAGAPIVTSGAGAPSSTPSAVGDVYVDTTADNAWIAAGTASSADWKQATGAGGGDLLAANNLSDVDSASTSRTNLGVAIGTDVQAFNANNALTTDSLDEFAAPVADLDIGGQDLINVGAIRSDVNTVASSGTTETLVIGANDVTMDDNCTFTFPSGTSGDQDVITLYLRQDGTGSRTATLPASVDWHGGTAPTLTTTASALDILQFSTVDGGTTWLGVAVALDVS